MTPETVASVAELEELLSRPTPDLEGALARLDGPLAVLGAGGKMGPSLARMARRAGADVVAVSRFGDRAVRAALDAAGVRTLAADLLERAALDALPDAAAVVFMAGRNFGIGAGPSATWALNAGAAWNVAERYAGVPTVVFSSGNVYPFVPASGPGADEATPPAPVGEYARSVLARERVFEHASLARATPVLLLRLNYAVELRYGVVLDVAKRVWEGRPVDLSTTHVNVIWQADANRVALRALERCATPPEVLNVTGPERVSIRDLAERFGELFARDVRFARGGVRFARRAQPSALLADARLARELFGAPRVDLERLAHWTAAWVLAGGETLGAPTHYEVREGAF